MTEKNTFILYRSDIAAARRLKDKHGADSALEFLFAIADYSLDQVAPTFANPSAEDAFYFADIQRRVDADVEKYTATIEKRRMAGQSGGIASGEARSKVKQNEANEANASKVKQTKQMLQSRSKVKQNEANEANEAVSVSVSVSESVSESISKSVNNSLTHTHEEKEEENLTNTISPLHNNTSTTIPTKNNEIHPSLEQILTFAQTIICPESLALEFFHHYEANGWTISSETPQPLRNWKSKLQEWKVKSDSKKASDKERQKQYSSTKQTVYRNEDEWDPNRKPIF